jgi:hypothetical protein
MRQKIISKHKLLIAILNILYFILIFIRQYLCEISQETNSRQSSPVCMLDVVVYFIFKVNMLKKKGVKDAEFWETID